MSAAGAATGGTGADEALGVVGMSTIGQKTAVEWERLKRSPALCRRRYVTRR